MEYISSLLLLFSLIAFSAFFSGAEIALVSLTNAKVRAMVEEKKRFAKLIQKLKNQPERLLITILIGSNLLNVWASVLANEVAEKIFGSLSIGFVIGIMTFLILVFSDMLPKTICHRYNVIFSQFSSPILWIVSIALWPLVFFLEKLSRFFIWVLGTSDFKSVTEAEVIAMLNIGHEEGEFNKQENEFIQNIFEFSDTTAEEIMVNRNEIEAYPHDITLAKILKTLDKNAHSRFPIYDTSIDNIIGYATVKDLVNYSRQKKNLKKKLDDLKLHKVLFFPVTKPINSIFKTFQQKRVHIAIILDEFGSTAGIITMEDVLEEIVGEIVDESDIEEKPIKKINKHVYMVEANTTLEEVFEYYPFDIDIPSHKTVAFLIIKKLGAFPSEGQKVFLEKQGIEFIVEKMAGKAIQKVRMVTDKKTN
jgi:CBS domain containing-hemolysin-like protein